MRLLILDRTGHTDTTLDLSTDEAISAAEALIREHQQKGAAIFQDGELLTPGRPFSVQAGETLVTMALQGG